MKNKIVLIVASLLLFFSVPSASYGVVIPLYNGSQAFGVAQGFTHGLSFSVTNKLQVSALGRSLASISSTGLIRLWKNNVQVASLSVPTNAMQSGAYRYVNLPSPIVFSAGETLQITADQPGAGTGVTYIWALGTNSGLALNGTIFSTQLGALTPSVSFFFPDYVPTNANAMFELVPTPEPMTYLLLGSFLALGIGIVSLRKRQLRLRKKA